jgi:hypothetical protein
MRKYEPAWKKLKANARTSEYQGTGTSGSIMLQVTTSTNVEVVSKHAATAIRGLQKEKYQDGAFRRKYPNALLTSKIDMNTGYVTIMLDLNCTASLADL